MGKFTEAHQQAVCAALSYDNIEELKDGMRATRDKLDGVVEWRSLLKTFEGKNIGNTRTRKTLIEVLQKLGCHRASEKWLNGEGEFDQQSELCLPNFIAPKAEVSLEDQKALAGDYGGFYKIYRPHGRNGSAVRELLYVSEDAQLNHEVFLATWRGAIYRGFAYRINNIVYMYFFRPQRRFKFAARTMIIDGTMSGTPEIFSGVITRITKSVGGPTVSDLVGVRVSQDNNINLMRTHIEENHKSADPVEYGKIYSDSNLPREFETIDDMSDFEKYIYESMRAPISTISQNDWDEIMREAPR